MKITIYSTNLLAGGVVCGGVVVWWLWLVVGWFFGNSES